MMDLYRNKLQKSNGVIVVEPNRLTPNEANEFKKSMVQLGSAYHVVKNTLFKLALKEAGLPEMDNFQNGMNSVIFIEQDVANTAKTLKKFIKDTEGKLIVKNGMLEGQLLSSAQVEALADLPTKEQSVAMIAGLLTNALAGVANVLEDSVRSVAYVIGEAKKAA